MSESSTVNGVAVGATPLMQLESLLFVASGPVSPARLATALDMTPAAVGELLRELDAEYGTRGLRLQWSGGGLVQLTTAAETAATRRIEVGESRGPARSESHE